MALDRPLKRFSLILQRVEDHKLFGYGQVIDRGKHLAPFVRNQMLDELCVATYSTRVVEIDARAGVVHLEEINPFDCQNKPDAWRLSDTQWKLPGDITFTEQLPSVPQHNQELVSSDWSKIMPEAWEISPKATEMLKPFIPTEREMSQEFARELRKLRAGVELECIKSKSKRVVRIKADPARQFLRDRLYSCSMLNREDVERGDVDKIRAVCFDSARGLAKAMAATIMVHEVKWLPPAGASVDYTSPFHKVSQVALRYVENEPIKYCRLLGDQPFACFDHVSDRINIRFRMYFAITPPGEEMIDD